MSRSTAILSYRDVLSICAALAIGLTGCVSEKKASTYYRPLPPKPRPMKPSPPDARANAMVLNVSVAVLDTNGNGYPDLIHATAHLFDRRYPLAIYEEGGFTFAMFAPGDVSRAGAEPIHQWLIVDERFHAARGRSAFGECYRFRLSLLEDDGTDELDLALADLVCVFEPADGGEPTWSGEVATIQIGHRVRIHGMRWRETTDPASEGGLWP
ncbi:MAG: hypothetical protein E2O40_03420 [Planctomycetota bacterium]|nr:MAG: hypothetical protein E2O40_03420 [Planctomycetota bacterium]